MSQPTANAAESCGCIYPVASNVVAIAVARQRQRFHGRRIAARPAIVESRKRVGDWEGDTIVGKGLSRVVTLVERKSGPLRMRRVPNGEAVIVMRAIVHAASTCSHVDVGQR